MWKKIICVEVTGYVCIGIVNYYLLGNKKEFV